MGITAFMVGLTPAMVLLGTMVATGAGYLYTSKQGNNYGRGDDGDSGSAPAPAYEVYEDQGYIIEER